MSETDVGRDAYRDRWRAAAMSVGFIAAAFTAVMCVLLIATHIQLKTSDPLNSPALVALRGKYAEDTTNQQYKEQIRQLDWMARKAFFVSREQIRTGSSLALGGAVLMVIAFGTAQGLRQKIPNPAGDSCAGVTREAINRSRLWVAGAGVMLAAVALVLTLAMPTELNFERTEPGVATSIVEPPPPAPQTDDRANSPGFRGIGGSGWTRAGNVPTEWNETTKKNILWKVRVALPGMSSPIVWGAKVYVSGATREQRELYCFAAADGKLLWTGTYTTDPHATIDYEVFDAPEAVMHAVPTPATDGRFVYAMFANGELACFDAESGKNIWSVPVGGTEGNQYGLANSLLSYRGSVIVMFEGDQSLLLRIDGATGRELWSVERDSASWASPILVHTAGGRDVVVTHGDPETAGWDAENGDRLWSAELVYGDVAPSPIAVNGVVFVSFQGCGLFAIQAESGEQLWAVEELDEGVFSDAQSMTTDGALLYQFYDDVLSVLDATNGEIVYEKTLDHSPSYASPFVAGDRLYLICGETNVIVETGREYREVGTCSLEEYSDINPAVVDGRIYMRTEKHLYCIGERLQERGAGDGGRN